jgi:hypothetical protein
LHQFEKYVIIPMSKRNNNKTEITTMTYAQVIQTNDNGDCSVIFTPDGTPHKDVLITGPYNQQLIIDVTNDVRNIGDADSFLFDWHLFNDYYDVVNGWLDALHHGFNLYRMTMVKNRLGADFNLDPNDPNGNKRQHMDLMRLAWNWMRQKGSAYFGDSVHIFDGKTINYLSDGDNLVSITTRGRNSQDAFTNKALNVWFPLFLDKFDNHKQPQPNTVSSVNNDDDSDFYNGVAL